MVHRLDYACFILKELCIRLQVVLEWVVFAEARFIKLLRGCEVLFEVYSYFFFTSFLLL